MSWLNNLNVAKLAEQAQAAASKLGDELDKGFDMLDEGLDIDASHFAALLAPVDIDSRPSARGSTLLGVSALHLHTLRPAHPGSSGAPPAFESSYPSRSALELNLGSTRLLVDVARTRASKCPRCWLHASEQDNQLCERCAHVLSRDT